MYTYLAQKETLDDVLRNPPRHRQSRCDPQRASDVNHPSEEEIDARLKRDTKNDIHCAEKRNSPPPSLLVVLACSNGDFAMFLDVDGDRRDTGIEQ